MNTPKKSKVWVVKKPGLPFIWFGGTGHDAPIEPEEIKELL